MRELDDRWANIHGDLLNEVAKLFYSYDDYVRCRLVCKEWNLKLPKLPENGRRRNLWLVLPEYDKSYCESLEEKKIHHVVLREKEDIVIRGSCYGWLICVVISTGVVRVLNPFTSAHFDLPPISTLPEINPPDLTHYHRDGEYTFICRCCDINWIDEVVEVHRRIILKIVISSPPPLDSGGDDFMAAVIYGGCGRLAFCRAKDELWEDRSEGRYFHDVIFFQGKIYAVDMHAQLFVFDAKRESSLLVMISKLAPSPHDIINDYFHSILTINKYLIVCDDGTLLMVVRHLRNNYGIYAKEVFKGLPSYEFGIFRLNENGKAWSMIHSLGNQHGLIIGQNSSVQASLFSNNVKGNHIYYSHIQVPLRFLAFPCRQHTGIFNLEDKSTEELLSNVKLYCPPTWLLH